LAQEFAFFSSLNKNGEGLVKEVKLTRLYRASENKYSARAFHKLCDGKGTTITLVKAVDGKKAAAYNSGLESKPSIWEEME
jgi:hypothetical protein